MNPGSEVKNSATLFVFERNIREGQTKGYLIQYEKVHALTEAVFESLSALYESIHPSSTSLIQSCGWAGAYGSCHSTKGGYTTTCCRATTFNL